MKQIVAYITPLFLCLSWLPLLAQEKLPKDTLKTQSFEEIVIQNNRVEDVFSNQNRDIIVLDSKTIEKLPVQSLSELLNYISGIDVRERGPLGGQADISINGGTFDQALVLINGIKIIDPQTGHNMLNIPISPTDIERIEVIKGAASSKHGINALNGAINIITKKPKENEYTASLTVGSSFEKDTSKNKLYGALGASVSASISNKTTQHFISFGTQQSTGYRYNTQMNNNKLFYQGKTDLNPNNSLETMFGYVYNDFGANGFYAPPADINSREIIQTGIASIGGNFQLTEMWKFRPSVSYRLGHDNYIFVREHPEIYQNKHLTNVLNVALDNSIEFDGGIMGIGVEYRAEAINSNSLGNRTRHNFGFFQEYSFTRFEKFRLTGGYYFNYSKSFGFHFLPSLELGQQIHKNWRIFANVGTGARVPTYTDWYYVSGSNIGNPNLKPERSIQTEGGVKFTNKHIRSAANYFYREVSDFIDWVKDSLNDPWMPQNFQTIRTHGISFKLDYRLLRAQDNNKINLLVGTSYTWLNPKMKSDSSQQTKFSQYALENLSHQVVLHATLGFLKNYGITLSGRYEQRVNYKDYFLYDIKAFADVWQLTLSLSVNNLSNITYIEAGAVPLPGRWISFGVQWRWK